MFTQRLKNWQNRQRYQEVIAVCLPLVMGMSATTVMEFTDRVFLANYSLEAIAAATPGGIAAFLCITFFGGIAGYCAVFIAQYHGAGRSNMIGAVLWQTIYFVLVATLLFLLIAHLVSAPLFEMVGHAPAIRELEATYFTLLCYAGIFSVANQALSGFFSGRGLTRPVMIVNIIAMVVNIPLDYALIFGMGPFPELGIAGAGLATAFSASLSTVILGLLVFTRKHEAQFGIFSRKRFDCGLFLRLLRFGVPGTMQFTFDILAFSVFILLVGRIGMVELAATNIVISINSIAFMPSLGVSQGLSVLVGQALGRRRPDQATNATWSSIHLLLGYILLVDLLFIFAPEPLINLFIPAGYVEEYQPVVSIATNLMRIVACYLFLDALYAIFAGVLRGAGDTRYLMWGLGLAALFCFILPLYIGLEVADLGIYFSWGCVLLFVFSLFTVTALRFRQSKWRSMLVIKTGRGEMTESSS